MHGTTNQGVDGVTPSALTPQSSPLSFEINDGSSDDDFIALGVRASLGVSTLPDGFLLLGGIAVMDG